MIQQVRAPLGGALALLLSISTIAGAWSEYVLIGAIILIVLLLAIGWPRLLDLPAPRSASLIIGASGLGALAVGTLLNQALNLEVPIAMVMATAFFLAILREMLRPSRTRLTLSLSGTVTGSLFSVLAVSWLQASAVAHTAGASGLSLLTAITMGLAAAMVTLCLPGSGASRIPLTLVSGALACAGIAFLLGLGVLGALMSFGFGLAIAGISLSAYYLLARVIAAFDAPGFFAVGAVPLAITGVAAMLFVRIGVPVLTGA